MKKHMLLRVGPPKWRKNALSARSVRRRFQEKEKGIMPRSLRPLARSVSLEHGAFPVFVSSSDTVRKAAGNTGTSKQIRMHPINYRAI
jgi:hypothetical protein